MSAGLKRLFWLIVPLALAAGCASTPQGTPERDAEVKQFRTYPATAAVYVYRSAFDHRSDDAVLYIDQRLIGSTLPGGFFRIEARPGKHVLHGIGHDAGHLEIEVRPGRVYFVSLNVIGGTSYFVMRDPEIGREELLSCCVLLENWAPGQRPLLR